MNVVLFDIPDGLLIGGFRSWAEEAIRQNHYTHGIPSGKSYWFHFHGAIVCYSIPANSNIAAFLCWPAANVWELTRLYAPDGHPPNLLTQAVAASVKWLRKEEPDLDLLVSYADPNRGHLGGIYRAASWTYDGQSEETRVYIKNGQTVSRRAFHSGGGAGLKHADIEALGFSVERGQGKHRFIRPISSRAKKLARGRKP